MSAPPRHSPPKVEQSGGVRILTFTADAVRDVGDVLARELEGRTDALGAGHLLLDFRNVTYLTSVELGTLITLHKRLRAAGGRLTLFNLSARVYEIFTTTRLQTLLWICREGGTDLAGTRSAKARADQAVGAETAPADGAGDPDNYFDCG